MPWKGMMGRQLTLERISVGKDTDGGLYSKKELRAAVDAVMDKDSPPKRSQSGQGCYPNDKIGGERLSGSLSLCSHSVDL
jgi:hypothetical protein